jgi:hypothetical protein
MAKITGAKVFTVSTAENASEDKLGADLTRWIVDNPYVTMEEKHVVQSDAYLSILIFYAGQTGENSPL